MDWKQQFEAEIAHGMEARQRGNEGMARVCARRAAGIVIAEYLQRRAPELKQSISAYDRLRVLSTLSDVPDEALEIAGLLLQRVTPEHTLPVQADLIALAKKLETLLLS